MKYCSLGEGCCDLLLLRNANGLGSLPDHHHHHPRLGSISFSTNWKENCVADEERYCGPAAKMARSDPRNTQHWATIPNFHSE